MAKEGFAVSGPGRYLPDVTEGVTRSEDLPKAKIIDRSRNFTHRPCPVCGRSCFRNRTGKRILHDVGDLVAGRPRDIHLVYSQHRCTQCGKYFNADMADYALPKAHYTHRFAGRATRRGGRLALSSRQLAPVARSSGFRSLRHHPELGGGRGEKRRPAKWTPTISIGPWLISPATARSTNCTTGRFACAALFASRMLCVWLGKPHVLSAAPITGFASSI